MNDKDKRVLVAHGEPDHPAALPTVIIGIPEGAFELWKDGLTGTVDLRAVGLRANLLLYRGKDHADCMRILQTAALACTQPAPLRDVGLKEPTRQ